MHEAAATHARGVHARTPYLAGRAMRSYSSDSTYAMRRLEPPPPQAPTQHAPRGTRPTAFLKLWLPIFSTRQASEPNTMHSLFASLCGMRPHLGMDKPEYSDKERLARCLPAEVRAAGIHSAFYTTSNVGVQKELGFGEVWSSAEDYTKGDWRSSTEDQKKYPGERIGTRDTTGLIQWPRKEWRRNSSAELLRGRTAGQYNWLGDHDFFGLPKVRGTLHTPVFAWHRPAFAWHRPAFAWHRTAPAHRICGVACQVRDFIAAQGENRFFLHLLTVSSHHPYGSKDKTSNFFWRPGTPRKRCPSLSAHEAASATMARKPVGTDGQALMLSAYLRELRCVDEYIKQANRLPPTSPARFTPSTLETAVSPPLHCNCTIVFGRPPCRLAVRALPGARHPQACGAAARHFARDRRRSR